MNLIRITGLQFAAGRVLASLSRQELAQRAGLSYHAIRDWERSSNAIPGATYSHLCRAIYVLEDAGVCFTDGGVCRKRPATPAVSTVMHSDGAAWVRECRASPALLPQLPHQNKSSTGADVHCARVRPRPWRAERSIRRALGFTGG